jgi:hypothetical protein
MKEMEKENKTLNLCEKLAGCPKGTMLWSPLFGECEFVALGEDMETTYPDECVVIRCDEMGRTYFDKHGHYFDSSEECMLFPSKDNRDWDNWECPKPKVERFDPKTFQPFDMVLVRDEDDDDWGCDFFERLREGGAYRNVTLSTAWHYCIPYNDDTKHLVGSAQEAPEYYRWWVDKA